MKLKADPDQFAFVATAEDTLLQKLRWYRLGDEVSDRQWRDVLGIDGITAEMNAGGMLSAAQVKNSLRIIASDVMPAFK